MVPINHLGLQIVWDDVAEALVDQKFGFIYDF